MSLDLAVETMFQLNFL